GGAGTLTIQYSSLDQLDDVLQRLSHTPQKAPVVDEAEAVISDIPSDADIPSLEEIIGPNATDDYETESDSDDT
ncbi:MAG: hypothetical protein HOH64_11725, partial [Rhodospirillales bacterium]|nr:hypothetical protein [Rhodospirillales bacterium]